MTAELELAQPTTIFIIDAMDLKNCKINHVKEIIRDKGKI